MSLSDDIKFESEKIDIKKNGNEVFAFKSKTLIPEDDITITSDKVRYLKKENILIFTENVIFYDNLNNITIISDKINYDRKINLINSEGPTKFNLTNYKIKSSNVFFDRNEQLIYGNEDTILKDKDGNIIKLKNKFNLNVEKEVAQAANSIILDKDDNKYIFEDLAINLKTNEIAGKEIKIDFKNSYFGNEKNDPLLKGKSSYSNENELKVYKAVFSTCNTINKSCRGWELNAEEFKHDKQKKVFEYKNSWLKILDFKVFYLPYFNHPDPSVKRKSGFLTPSYGSSDSLGTQINFPYFKVLSDDKDISFQMGSSDVYLLTIDSDGNLLSEQTFGGSNFDKGKKIEIDNKDNIWLTGYSRSTDFEFSFNKGKNDAVLIQLSKNRILKEIFEIGAEGEDIANSLIHFNENEIIVAGYSDSRGDYFVENKGGKDIFLAFFK